MKHIGIPALRSQDMVFTLYGDYLLERTRPVWVGSLIDLLGTLGLTPMAVRLVVSRMTRKGWLTVERRGTHSFYGLTRRGARLLAEGRERIYHRPQAEPWDGAWCLVSFSIPEAQRRLRDQLRVKLLWLGCGPLANGLWISPRDVRAEVRAVAEALRITRHLEVFRATHQGYSDVRHLMAQVWDLSAVNQRYATFLSRWSHVAAADPAECFLRRFHLVHEFRTFPFEDPFLPPPLLPDPWHGGEAAQLFERLHRSLAEPAERFVRDVVAAGEAPQARDVPLARRARATLAATH